MLIAHSPGHGNPLDKFGYYSVNGKNFYNKIQAYLEQKNSKQPVEYIFNDHIYECYDWTQEPEPWTGLLEFYRRRAQQIRDKYDYVVLLCSGGPDSTNMFEAFANNNIRIDHVVNFNSYTQTQRTEDTANNADYVFNFKPHIEEYIKNTKNLITKITVLDEIELTKKYLVDYKNIDYEVAYGLLTNITGFMYCGGWIKYVPEIWDRIVRGENLCIVIGSDKPWLTVVDGKYAVQFVDLGNQIDWAVRFDSDPAYRGLDITESFYQSRDDVNLRIKQAHILKNYMSNNPESGKYMSDEFRRKQTRKRPSYHCENKDHPGSTLRYAEFHKTIYPNWNPQIVTPKPEQHMIRTEDDFWSKKLDLEVYSVWARVAYQYRKDFAWVGLGQQGVMPFMQTRKYFLE